MKMTTAGRRERGWVSGIATLVTLFFLWGTVAYAADYTASGEFAGVATDLSDYNTITINATIGMIQMLAYSIAEIPCLTNIEKACISIGEEVNSL